MFKEICIGLCILAVSFLGVGCTTIQKHDTAAKIFTQYAVARYVESSGSALEAQRRGENVARVAADLLSVVSDSQAVTVPYLKQQAAVEIAKLTSSPADRLLAANLVDVIAQELQSRIGDGLLKADDVLIVRDVLHWIIEAADAVAPIAPAQPAT